MDTPAQTGDTGHVDDSAASSTAQDTTQTNGEPTAASAGTENTETQPAMVPSGRLREEADKRRAAEAKLQEMTERLERLEAAAATAPQADPTVSEPSNGYANPPDSITDPRERAAWIVEQDAKRYLERELGMPLAQVRTLLGTTKVTAEDYASRTWREGCQRHGLDPENREVAEVVQGLVKGSGFKLDDAFQRASKLYGKAPAAASDESASVETSGGTGAMTTENIVPKSVQHARELAEKGVAIKHTPMHELIRSTVDEERKRAGPQHIRQVT